MRVPTRARKWLRLPSRAALLLGIGAFSVGSAEATALDQGKHPTGVPQAATEKFGELRVWTDGEQIFLIEASRPARELRLGDTAEARRLRELLQLHGATSVRAGIRFDQVILAGGGGSGFDWAPPGRKPNATAPTASPGAHAVIGQRPILPPTARSPQSRAPATTAQAHPSSKD
jgi:hypothetical protein